MTPLGIALKPVFENISKDLNKIIYKGLSDTDAEKLEILLNNISENFTEQWISSKYCCVCFFNNKIVRNLT